MDELKPILGDDLYAQVMSKLGSKKLQWVNNDLVDKKDWIPKDVHLQETKKLKEELEGRSEDMTKLKEQLSEAEKDPEKLAGLQRTISDNDTKYKDKDKTAKAEMVTVKKNFAIELALKDAKCVHSELLVPKVNHESVVEIDGKYVVPEAVIDGLKEKYKETFGEVLPHGDPARPNDPSNPARNGDLEKLKASMTEALKKGDTLGSVKLRRLITESEHKGT